MSKENLVLLHGWGFNSFIWDPILPELSRHFNVIALDLDWSLNENLCDWIAQNSPEKAIYLGWSLGGLMAMKMSIQYPDRVQKIISVCASPYFLREENWPGIESHLLDAFKLQFDQGPTAWAQKFISSQLGKMDQETLNLARFFSAPLPTQESLEAGLSILKNTDIRAQLSNMEHEKLFIFGRLDRITLEKTSQALIDLGAKNISCKIIKRAAHIPFLSHSDVFLEYIDAFCKSRINNRKMLIKKSFNQSAPTYQEAARLQEKCGEKLLARLPKDFAPTRILELGCGTGLLTRRLQEEFPNATITAIDIAEKMLWKMQEEKQHVNVGSSPSRRPVVAPKLELVCADAESLPFLNNSFDLIISNFTLQWCEINSVFAECQRLLKNKGYFYFCTLGENTLTELKSCWNEIDQEAHVNEFPSKNFILTQLKSSALQNVVVADEVIQEHYDHPMKVLSQIKAWGAQNIHKNRPKTLSAKSKFEKLIELYQEQFTNEKGIYASYHTLYGCAQKN